MKIVVIGGSGLIGSKLVNKLRELGHEVVVASPSSGVNTITGEGLKEVLKDTEIVIDLANSPSWEDKAVLDFFETSGRNLLAAEEFAGVSHHIALSIVGIERLPDNGYFRAKLAQEKLIKQSKIPYTIVRSTQFLEFVSGIAQGGLVGEKFHMSTGFIQPIASDDVVALLADVDLGKPINGTIEIAGPEKFRLDELVRKYLSLSHDDREVVTDVHAKYFGSELNDESIVPGTGSNPRLGSINYETWFKNQSNKSN